MPQDTNPHDSPATPESLLEHAAWLRRLVRALVSDAAQADDVMQETWLASLKHPPRRAVRAWLRSVAQNVARSFHRSGSRRQRREQMAAPGSSLPDPARMAERVELQRYLLEQVQALDEPYRTTLLLRYYEDLEPKEIARRSGTPAGTVRARLSRGLEMLRARLDDRCDGKRSAWVALLALPAFGRAAAAGGVLVSVKAKVALAAIAVLAIASVFWVGKTVRSFARDAARHASSRRRAPATPSACGSQEEGSSKETTEPGDAATAKPAWRLSGRVLDRVGNPVPGARVFVEALLGAVYLRLDETRTDELGRYTADLAQLRKLRPLQRSVARLFARAVADGHKPGRESELTGDVSHEEPDELTLSRDLVLEKGLTLKGRVLLPDGRPAAGADVEVDGPGKDSYRRTEPDGTFVAPLHAAGAHVVRAWQQEVGAASVRLRFDAAESASVPDLVLQGAGRIEGVVVDPSGLPCRDVELWAEFAGEADEWPSDGLQSATARTDPDGRFVLAGLGTGRYKFGPSETYPTGARNVRLVLGGVRVRLRVRISDESGEPLLGAWVNMQGWGARDAPAVESYLEGRVTTPPQALRRALSRPVILFRPGAIVRLTEPGSLWILSGSIRGAAPFQRVVKVPKTGVREIDVDLTFARQRETGRLELRLRDACDQPVLDYGAGFGFPIGRKSITHFRARAGDKDRLSPPLSPRRYVVGVRPGPPLASFYFGFETTVEIRANETTLLERELRTGGLMRVRVQVPDREEGENVRNVVLDIRSSSGKWVSGASFISPQGDTLVYLRNGKTAILQTLLEPGAYEVTLRARGYQPAQRPVAIKAGEFTEAVFRLARK